MRYLILAIVFFLALPALALAQNGDPLASPDALAEWLTVYGLPAVQVYVTAWTTVLLVQRIKPLLEKLGVPADLQSQGRKWVLSLVSWGVGVGGFFLIDQFTAWASLLGEERWVYLVGVIALTYKLYKGTRGAVSLLLPTAELIEMEGRDG